MSDVVELWILRHAEARERLHGESDAERELTQRGGREARRLRAALCALGVEFDLLFHSPLARAVETADVLAPLARETRVTGLLARAPDRELLAEFSHPKQGVLALIGHEPWLGELAFWLVTGWSVNAPELQPRWIALAKGGALRLRGELAPGRMVLEAVLDARAIKDLGRR